MRGIPFVVALLAFAPLVHADPLTQADREALLEKLQKIQDAADAKVDERFKVAVAAFRTAMVSDTAAFELYMKCLEKVQFEEQHKKSQDFRDFKRKQDDKLGDPGFRAALRHQLRWLVLTLQVASSKKPSTTFSGEALKAVDDIFLDADKLNGHQNVLKQGVLGTVFAQAYDLNSVNVENWPNAPLQLTALYDKVVMPPLRNADKTDALRSAWMKRIQQEGLMHEKWSKAAEGDRIGTKDATRPPEYEKFIEETYPDLLWEMEEDIFKAGDQRGAALRMFQHLEKYAAHTKAPDWAKSFKELLTPRTPQIGTGATSATGR